MLLESLPSKHASISRGDLPFLLPRWHSQNRMWWAPAMGNGKFYLQIQNNVLKWHKSLNCIPIVPNNSIESHLSRTCHFQLCPTLELKSDICMFSHPGDIGQCSESLDIRMGGSNQSERNILEERSGLGCTRGKTLAGERPEGCQSVTCSQLC